MRWLFLLMLGLNVAYVGWKLSQDSSADTIAQTQFEGVEPIVLLSELEAEKTAGEDASNEAAANKSTTITGDQTVAKATEVVGVEAEPEAEKKPEPGSEAESQPEQVVTVPLPDRCYTLGPFRELKRLSAFTRDIKDYVVEASFRARDEAEQSMYWVYLDPVGSLGKATQLSGRLKSQGIKDHYIIKSGDKNSGISLGHFKEKERAYKHAWEIKAKGFSPSVEPVFKSFTIYWLDYRVQQGRDIPKPVLKKHLTQKLSRLDRPCS